MRTSQVVAYAFQLAASGVFLGACLPKLRDPIGFRRTVSDYAIVPSRLVPFVASFLIASEVFVGISLVTGYLARIGLLFAAALLGVFGIGIGVNLYRGRHITCGCFGSKSDSISMRSLARIGLLLGPVLALLVIGDSGITLGTILAGGADSVQRLVAAGGIAVFLFVFSAWLLALPDLARVFQTGRPRFESEDADLSR